MNPPRIVIAGGSGFIGSTLAQTYSRRGFEVAVLTRSPRPRSDGVHEIAWDGATNGPWISQLNGASALINLAGKNINCPHTPANLLEITASRVNAVTALAAAVRQAESPPWVWVQASAVGFYGDTGSVACDENAPPGGNALAGICRQWEAAFASASLPRTRKVTLRIGFALGREGGALPLMRQLTGRFLGGATGNGRQYLSWIHLADLAAVFTDALENERMTGAFNATAPLAVTNAEFMRELRRVMHRPWCPPTPAFAVKAAARLMGSEGSLALVSQRCVPRRLVEAGFQFKFANLPAALQDLCREE